MLVWLTNCKLHWIRMIAVLHTYCSKPGFQTMLYLGFWGWKISRFWGSGKPRLETIITDVDQTTRVPVCLVLSHVSFHYIQTYLIMLIFICLPLFVYSVVKNTDRNGIGNKYSTLSLQMQKYNQITKQMWLVFCHTHTAGSQCILWITAALP